LILSGHVKGDGRIITKAGALVPPETTLEVTQPPPYVSRGGEKLAGALQAFGINPQGRVCLDVGASTGGFTDCLLQRGASKVYAVDVGRNQLDQKLKKDPRVVVLEKTHILRLAPEALEPRPDLATIDVSFISSQKVLAHVATLLCRPFDALVLVKPQFEVGPKRLKKGVVREEALRLQALKEACDKGESLGLRLVGTVPSPLKGAKGNVEYFAHFKA